MNQNTACHISKQRTLQPSSHHITATPKVNPGGAQDINKMPFRTVHLEETWDKKAQDTGPKYLRCISKEWFQWAQTLYLLIHRKALNSLTWDIWFSLINSTLLMFQLPGLYWKNSYISWLPPCLFDEAVPGHLRSCVPGLSSNCPPN